MLTKNAGNGVAQSAQKFSRVLLCGVLGVGGLGCHHHLKLEHEKATSQARLFKGLGTHKRPVTTSSAEAQRYFDQGLVWTFAFNHDEAIRSFTEAARLDPNCAMAWWGVALCHGPHINNATMPEYRSLAACEAMQKAQALKAQASPLEQSLIDALAKRYSCPPPEDRKPLDQAYADAMREVWKKNRTDTDIGVLFAESMMDLRPWDLWTKDKKPQPGTEEIVAVLEDVLRMDPYHPGALHLYIHTVEASSEPLRALEPANRLRHLVPAAGHLVHMPSHIDIQAGQWKEASEANERAIEADRRYRSQVPTQGFYRMYMAHNSQFLTFSSMMEGRSKVAMREARKMVAAIPPQWIKDNVAIADGFILTPIETLVRFGHWDDVLNEPAPPEYLPITTAFWRFARGVAFAAKGNVADAETEQSRFRDAAKRVPESATVGNSPASKVLMVAEHMLAGEIAFRRGRMDESVAELKKAIEFEEDLNYDEPPDWLQPVRHTLGAVLMAAGRHAEAEAVYRADLKRWPENGWSLRGLEQALRARGATEEAALVEQRFRKAWARADVEIGSSCKCVVLAANR